MSTDAYQLACQAYEAIEGPAVDDGVRQSLMEFLAPMYESFASKVSRPATDFTSKHLHELALESYVEAYGPPPDEFVDFHEALVNELMPVFTEFARMLSVKADQ